MPTLERCLKSPPAGRPLERITAAGRAWGAYPIPTLHLPWSRPGSPAAAGRGLGQGYTEAEGAGGIAERVGDQGKTHVHVDGWPTHRRGNGFRDGSNASSLELEGGKSKRRTQGQARPKGRMNKSIVGPNPSRAIHPSFITSHARPPYAYVPTLYLPYTLCLPYAYPVPTLHPAQSLPRALDLTLTCRRPGRHHPSQGLPYTYPRAPQNSHRLPCTYPRALRKSMAYPTPMPTLYLPYTYPTLAARLPCTYPGAADDSRVAAPSGPWPSVSPSPSLSLPLPPRRAHASQDLRQSSPPPPPRLPWSSPWTLARPPWGSSERAGEPACQAWARGRVAIFRKKILYGIPPKSTHGKAAYPIATLELDARARAPTLELPRIRVAAAQSSLSLWAPTTTTSHTSPLRGPPWEARETSGKSRRRTAYPQQIVTTRLLYCLQDRFAQLSRLQRI